MIIKLIVSNFIVILCIMTQAHAQESLQHNKEYTGAQTKNHIYRAVYQLDQDTPATIKKTIRNINNLLKDPRLLGKLEIELVGFSGGVEAFRKGSAYEEDIKALVSQGVIVALCQNTIRERKIDKSELYDFLAYVPSGNGELLIRANDGWTIIKP